MRNAKEQLLYGRIGKSRREVVMRTKSSVQLAGCRDLDVYKLSYKMALEIFDETKKFPKEEKYSLTDQIRRSSRSVAANIGEA